MKVTPAAVLAALALAGCGGGSSYSNTQELADALGCGDTHSTGHSRSASDCTIEGRTYELLVVDSNTLRDEVIDGLSDNLDIAQSWIIGDRWAVGAPRGADAKAIADRLGGDVLDL